MHDTTRREFLKTAAAALAAAQFGSTVLAAQADSPAGLPTRPLGKTGQRVSIIARGFKPLTPDDVKGLSAKSQEPAAGVRASWGWRPSLRFRTSRVIAA
jgi:hypothetical protein